MSSTKRWFAKTFGADPLQLFESHAVDEWFDESCLSSSGQLLEQEATINSVLRPGQEWRIKFRGCLWHARAIAAPEEFFPGDIVYVVARKGNTLLVNPWAIPEAT